MPAKSIAQRRFMAMAEHGKLPEKDMPHMSKEKMHEFAKTKEKHLPMHKAMKKKGISRKNHG